ncbi:MAG: protein kinase [Kofleriaceae bacterium]
MPNKPLPPLSLPPRPRAVEPMSESSRLGQTVLGGFRLLKVIGEGGFGTAFLAEQTGLGRLAVVKVLRHTLLAGPRRDAILARFETEVRAATRLQHPNLATVYIVDQTPDGVPAVAMEFIDGETLRSRLERLAGQPMAVAELEPLFRQLVNVLGAVHGQRIRHGDLSPNNVMLAMDHSGNRVVKLLDFGIASLLDSSDGEFVAGTPGYSAPEQFRGETTTDSDLFGIGALMYWAATGRELFAPEYSPDRIVEEMRAWQTGPDPRDVCEVVPANLAALIRGLLDPNPGIRPALDEIIEELDALLYPDQQVTSRRVLVVDPDQAIGSQVAPHLSSFGVRVASTTDPRRATRSEGEFAAILVNARLTAPRAAAVYAHLAEFMPDVPVLVVAAGAGPVEWDEVPFANRVRLPGGAYRLVELGQALQTKRMSQPSWTPVRTGKIPTVSDGVPPLAPNTYLSGPLSMSGPIPVMRGTPISGQIPMGSQPTWTPSGPIPVGPSFASYVGQMPELLLELEGALADAGAMMTVAEQIEQLARGAGARDVEKLAQTLRLLVQAGDLDDPSAFIDSVQDAYVRSVRTRAPAPR